MTDLKAQKRLAADVLGVGKNRVRFDPDAQGEIADAITRDDVRELIEEGIIEAETAEGNSRGSARERNEKRSYGHRTGHGSRKGGAGSATRPIRPLARRPRLSGSRVPSGGRRSASRSVLGRYLGSCPRSTSPR